MGDDLDNNIYARSFGDGLHEGTVSLMSVDYLENILVAIAYDLAATNISEERLDAYKDV